MTQSSSAALISFDRLSLHQKECTETESALSVTEHSSVNSIYWVTEPSSEIPIRMDLDENSAASDPPMTVMKQLIQTATLFPSRDALCVERNGVWHKWTYTDYLAQVCDFAKALIHIGVDKFQGVSIIGFNSPEWLIADVGAIFAGCLPAGIYSTNGPEACHYVASHSKAAVIVVEDERQLEKILKVRHRLPDLKAIVQWSGDLSIASATASPKDIYSWKEFMSLSSQVQDSELEERMASAKAGECCSLIYTSGTTGNPKAVMLSHDNITWTAKRAVAALYNDLDSFDEVQRGVSYLPLSHIAAQLVDIHGPMVLGSTTYFAKPDALKGSLVQTLSEVHPTQFLGVPRVWEKIEEKMRATGAANSQMKQSIGTWAKDIGYKGTVAKLQGESLPWGWTLADKLVFSNIKKALGFDQTTSCFTGAAPIGMKTMDYFMSLDIPLYEVYGMSETSGPHTVNTTEKCKIGTVGMPLEGVELRLNNPDAKGEGEICMRGRNIFMGYLFNPEATRSTIDDQGWLHSGDLGRIDHEGFLKITGRIKELIITAGGENIAPVLIEDTVKEELPAISNIMVIGDKRKYLSCLITLKSDPDAEGRPTDNAAGPTKSFLAECQSNAQTISDAIVCPKVLQSIEVAIQKANKRAISRAHHIRKWALLSGDFTLESGELTPTMKLKRRVVYDNYIDKITSLYPDTETTPPPPTMSKL